MTLTQEHMRRYREGGSLVLRGILSERRIGDLRAAAAEFEDEARTLDATLLEIGITTDPSTIENGCLYVLPGSHVGPALDHTENAYVDQTLNLAYLGRRD